MEDSQKYDKINGQPEEDYHLCGTRTEAILQGKEVFNAVTTDVLRGEITPGIGKKVAQARAIISQGLGRKPLRVCLINKSDPYNMCSNEASDMLLLT